MGILWTNTEVYYRQVHLVQWVQEASDARIISMYALKGIVLEHILKVQDHNAHYLFITFFSRWYYMI